MTKSPQEFETYFSNVYSRLNSNNPDDHSLVATEDFKQVVTRLASEFRQLAPTAKDVLLFSRDNQFAPAALLGSWMAVGIAAGTKGPDQDEWIATKRQFTAYAGHEPGFRVMRLSMEFAHNAVASFDDRVQDFRSATNWIPEPDSLLLDQIKAEIQSPPEVNDAIRAIAGNLATDDLKSVPLQRPGRNSTIHTLDDGPEPK